MTRKDYHWVEQMEKLEEDDAFGRGLWEYYQGNRGHQIIERDDGYLNGRSMKRFFAEYEEWSASEKKAIHYAKGKVLDVGCGAGRHALYLQEKGHEVLGFDISPLAIKICKKRGLKHAKVLRIAEIDNLSMTFDTVLLMGKNFGLLGDFERAQRLLKEFYEITTKDGLIIANTANPHENDTPVHSAYHKRNKENGRMPGLYRIRFRFQEYATDWFDYLFASKEEIKEILEETKWRVKEFIDPTENPEYTAILAKEAANQTV